MPAGVVYVGRPTRWGNPYDLGAERFELPDGSTVTFPGGASAQQVVDLYRRWAAVDAALVRAELAGRDLACWCPLDQACHADVLLQLANTLSCAPGQGTRGTANAEGVQ